MQTLTAKSERSAFYKTLSVLALPIVVQNLVDAAVNTADTVMLNFVGQSSLAAASLANQVQFVLFLIFYGVCSGSSVLIAQYWGRRDTATIEKTMGIALRFSLSVAVLFALAALCAPRLLMGIFTPEEELIDLGSKYLQMVAVSYLASGFTSVYTASMRSTERVIFGTVVNSVALGVNVLLNACFIFGLVGFPKLGIVGVGIATTIARLVALSICLIDAARAKVIRLRVRALFERNKALFADYLRYTLPALGNDMVWGLGFSMYSVILGHMGGDAVAANSYAQVARTMGTVVCFALANAAAIIMGKTMGENRLDDARVYGKRFMWLAAITGVAGGLLVLAATPFVVPAVQLSDTARGYLRFMLYMSCLSVFGQSFNTMAVCGIFRAGGDTKFGFYMDTTVMWAYGVALGSFAAFVLHWPTPAVYALMFSDEFVKIPFALRHYWKRLWVKNITRDFSEA